MRSSAPDRTRSQQHLQAHSHMIERGKDSCPRLIGLLPGRGGLARHLLKARVGITGRTGPEGVDQGRHHLDHELRTGHRASQWGLGTRTNSVACVRVRTSASRGLVGVRRVGVAVRDHLLGGAFKDDLAAVVSGLGADVDDQVCGGNYVRGRPWGSLVGIPRSWSLCRTVVPSTPRCLPTRARGQPMP